MHKLFAAFIAVTIVLPIGLIASPVSAASAPSCATGSGTWNFSPPLPASGDPTTVNSTVTESVTIGGCVGLGGITGGTGVATFPGPGNCDALFAQFGQGALTSDSAVITWNTGQTSTVNTSGAIEGELTAGLFAGADVVTREVQYHEGCASPTAAWTWTDLAPTVFTMPSGLVSCTSPQPCDSKKAASATASAPGLSVHVTGTPAAGIGTATATLTITASSGSPVCPKVTAAARPVATLADTGFKPTDKLNVTATLPLASSTSAEQVCFNSTVPFKSQSSPTVAKSGTAFLLNCSQVANAAPCITSSTQVGSNVVVKFVVPGGDPRFYIVLPTGRQLWLSHFAAGKTGQAYTAQLQSSGGIAPISWKVVGSGSLPKGLTLNPKTGAITGKPTVKGSFPVVVQATDSEKPAKTATLNVPVTVT